MGCCCGAEEHVVVTRRQQPKQMSGFKGYDDKPWEKLPVPKHIKITLHEHVLVAMDDINDDQWKCDGISLFRTGCYGGITDFH